MTQLSSNLRLIYQICGKICHDFAAPLSAVSLGLELLEEEAKNEQSLELVQSSTKSATNKLKFLRCLFGFSGQSGNKPTLEDIQEAASLMISPEKHQVIWNNSSSFPLKGEAARLILGCVAIGVEGCPRGGVITVNPNFSLSCHGKGAHLSDDAISLLKGEEPEAAPSSRDILALFSGLLATSLGATIDYVQMSQNDFNIIIA